MRLKLLVAILIILSLIPISLADYTTENIDVKFDFPRFGCNSAGICERLISEFKGEGKFNISIRDQSTTYTFSNSSNLDSQTWRVPIKINITEENCEQFTGNQNLYSNFTNMVAIMGNTCDEVIKYTNSTAPYMEELLLCGEERGNCAGIMQEKNIKITELESRSGLYDNCLSEKMSCESGRSSCLDDKNDLENKPDYSLLLGALGLGVGWAIWGRKKQRAEFGEEYGARR